MVLDQQLHGVQSKPKVLVVAQEHSILLMVGPVELAEREKDRDIDSKHLWMCMTSGHRRSENPATSSSHIQPHPVAPNFVV